MAFIEEGTVEYVTIDGKKVPVVKCEAEIVLRNKKTNQEYNSDKEAEDDIANPDTCLLYTSPSPRDLSTSRMPSSA